MDITTLVGLIAGVIVLSTLAGALLMALFVFQQNGGQELGPDYWAGTFGAMSFYGFITKRDLTSFGHFMLMGLFGLILASIVNVFMHSPTIYWLTTFAGVLVFTGLTAYDVQKIKGLNDGVYDTEQTHKSAIHGALVLYLDFINMFLYLLRLLGRRR